MQTIKLKIVQPLVHHELVIQNGQWIRFYFSGSICRKQFLSIQHLVILNCMYYFSFLNKKTPNRFVRSIYNTCRNFFLFYVLYGRSSTKLNSMIHIFNFSWNTPVWRRRHELSSLIYLGTFARQFILELIMLIPLSKTKIYLFSSKMKRRKIVKL